MHGAGGVYPSMHWAVGVSAWGCVSHHALGRGCLPRGGVYPEGVSAQRGCLPGGVADTPWDQGQTPPSPEQRQTPPALWTDRQLRLRAVITRKYSFAVPGLKGCV